MATSRRDERLAVHLARFSPSPSRDVDAGLKHLSHYERRLPRWRHRLRQSLIPIVRWETPYLARVQETCRSAFLDSYFAFTANLGTHTFFMAFLPACFWGGHPEFGTALVHMLGLGVYLSGAVKDLVCLPRPLSPPLQRITMSGSAALEYGFPSTHTTNAVSVALFALDTISLSREEWSPTGYNLARLGFICYALSITLGRMYCGMHGFFDVVAGGLLGAFLTWLRVTWGPFFDFWIVSGGWTRPAAAVVVLGFAVRFHPEPADNCPCFDDSVAFLGVIMGVTIGTWHYAQVTGIGSSPNPSLLGLYPYSTQDLLKTAARLVGGIVVIFIWRAVMKPLLLAILPPTFRFVNHWGLMIPRRYFLQASDYKQVPTLRKDDNVLPAASDIPAMLSSMRHPRRRRISVGPQSEADARELLASREQRRKESRSRSASRRKQRQTSPSTLSDEESVKRSTNVKHESGPRSSLQVRSVETHLLTPPTSDGGASSDSGKEDDKRDREMFLALEKPRIRYDVEVITKLVVYAGIAWLAVEGNPLWFQQFGLV